MKEENLLQKNAQYRRLFILTVALLCASTLSNVVLGFAVSARKESVILVPTLPSELRVGSGSVQAEYIEMLTRDTAYLILNRHPNNTEYFEQALLQIVDPGRYAQVEAQLQADRENRIETATSPSFMPIEIYVDPSGDYSEIVGRHFTYVDQELIASETKVFAARWVRQGMSVKLADFAEIEMRERKGGAL